MHYISTRGQAPELNFEDAMMSGLARDGGLYVPQSWPDVSLEIPSMLGKSYQEIAHQVMLPFIGDTFTPIEFEAIIDGAYASFRHAAICPISQLGANDFLLELYHGPTLAFKDVAMQLIGQMFEASLKRQGKRLTIVGATSGDTGSAAIEAFRGLENVDVFIMYPHGRVSDVQRRQMTTAAEANVHALAIDGDFDACQARLKDMFNDHAFRDSTHLAGVNSINWARVMAQVVYYFTSALSLGAPQRPVAFTVPTGNFGDIFAGYVAGQMGLPIDRLIVATNQNDILHRTFDAGDHHKGGVTPSISPSMDIQVSSNFERLLFDMVERDPAPVRQMMDDLRDNGGFDLPQGMQNRMSDNFASGRASEAETLATITRYANTTGRSFCPHTAVGLHVADALRGDPAIPMITLATAHAAKFPDAVREATGREPALPAHMADLFEREERFTRLPDDLEAIKSHIISARTK